MINIVNFKTYLSRVFFNGIFTRGMMTFEVEIAKKLAGLAILSGRIMSRKQITNGTLLQLIFFHSEQDQVLPLKINKATEYLKINKCSFESHI